MQQIIRNETKGHTPPSLLVAFALFAHIVNVCGEDQLYAADGVSSFGTSDGDDWLGYFLDNLLENDSYLDSRDCTCLLPFGSYTLLT